MQASNHTAKQEETSATKRKKIPQDCNDFNFGFCVKGPQCQYIHNKKNES